MLLICSSYLFYHRWRPKKKKTDRRLVKLKVDGITIPFPEDIERGWMKDFVYFPDLTMDCIRDYAKKSISEKGLKEGANL